MSCSPNSIMTEQRAGTMNDIAYVKTAADFGAKAAFCSFLWGFYMLKIFLRIKGSSIDRFLMGATFFSICPAFACSVVLSQFDRPKLHGKVWVARILKTTVVRSWTVSFLFCFAFVTVIVFYDF